MQPMASMALRAARNAGRIIARAVDRIDVIKVEEKQKNDLVSDIDRAAEAAIIEELHKTYPGHSIIGEESGKAIDGDEDYTWIIDPLDGTTNFLHGIPHFAVSIGCVHRGRIEHAVVWTAPRRELRRLTRPRRSAQRKADPRHPPRPIGFGRGRHRHPLPPAMHTSTPTCVS